MPEKEAETEAPRKFFEQDNLGTRHDTPDVASSYWIGRQVLRQREPFLLYVFDNEQQARTALLQLPCIHEAADSGKLICTKVLAYGCYRKEGKYWAVLCGDELTRELWEQAKTAFEKHGGRLQSDLEPPGLGLSGPRAQKRPTAEIHREAPDIQKVTFVREETIASPTKTFSVSSSGISKRKPGTMIYRIHRAPDAACAKAFLQQNPVTKPLYYIVVETPEGNFGRDAHGIYKE